MTGEYRLERKVRDFADNWDYNRGKLIEKLEFLRDGLDAIVDTITNAHAGVMPAWRGRLDPATIKMLAAYVHSLGGGQ